MSRRRKKINKTRERKEDDCIQKCYRQPGLPGSLASISALRRALLPERLDVSRALAGEENYTLHRPIRYRFPRRPSVVAGPGQQLQCDLVDCSAYKKHNAGTRFLFCCIDVFSKYAWVRTLQSKRGKETAATMEDILKEMDKSPLSVQSDKGSEMRATAFQRVLQKRGIHFFTSENDDIKASIVERFQKTLQNMIHRHMTATRSHAFVDILPALMRTYNGTYHSAIGMAPMDVDGDNTEHVWLRLYGPDRKERVKKMTDGKGRLTLGNHVRISKARRPFAKAGQWSKEIFLVTTI